MMHDRLGQVEVTQADRCPGCGSALGLGMACPVCGRPQPEAAGAAVQRAALVIRRRRRRGAIRRAVGFATGLLLLGVFLGFGVAAITEAATTQPADAVNPAALVGAFAGVAAFGLIAGLLVCFLSWRPGFVAVAVALAPALVVAGTALMSAAPIVDQLESRTIAGHASAALLAAGLAYALIGVMLAAPVVSWLLRPGVWALVRPIGRWLAVAAGAVSGLSGMGIALLTPFAAFGDSETSSVSQAAAASAAAAALALIVGVILTFHGISAAMGEASSRSWLPAAPLFLGPLALALLVGGLAMRLEPPPAAVMPPLHVAAGLLPGMALAALAAHGSLVRGSVSRLTWRQALLTPAVSMVAATSFAGIIELWASGIVLAGLLASAGAFDGTTAASDVRVVFENYEDYLGTGRELAMWLAVAAVVAPLAEEFFKGAAARLTMTDATSRRDAFTLGAVSGAAFGAVEALTYGLAGFSGAAANGWWSLMLMRGGASGMHALAAGLVALGWYDAMHGRGWRWFRWYAAAVLLHGFWNALNVLVGTRLLFPMEGLSDQALERLVYAAIAPLALASVAALPLIGRRLRRAEPPQDLLPTFEPVLIASAVY